MEAINLLEGSLARISNVSNGFLYLLSLLNILNVVEQMVIQYGGISFGSDPKKLIYFPMKRDYLEA